MEERDLTQLSRGDLILSLQKFYGTIKYLFEKQDEIKKCRLDIEQGKKEYEDTLYNDLIAIATFKTTVLIFILLIIFLIYMSVTHIGFEGFTKNLKNILHDKETLHALGFLMIIIFGISYSVFMTVGKSFLKFFNPTKAGREKTEKIMFEKVIPAEAKLQIMQNECNEIINSDIINFILPSIDDKYIRTDTIKSFITYLQDGRANNLQEAISLYEKEHQ